MNQESFFIGTALGFEQETLQELKEIWGFLVQPDGSPHHEAFPEMEEVKGGLEFQASLAMGLQLNFLCKTGHRILLRLAHFKCRELYELEGRLRKISLKPYLGDQKFLIEVAAQTSRLNNEKRIAQTAQNAWGQQIQERAQQSVMIRFENDFCTVSLDTTGEHLHKRGYRSLIGEAPLRETLAALLLRQLIDSASLNELQNINLIDPTCGSGTFLLEAHELYKANLSRDYAFQNWPFAPKFLKKPHVEFHFKKLSFSPFAGFYGFDQDEKVLQAAQKNLAKLQIPAKLEKIDWLNPDLEKISLEGEGPRNWLILNPPYGIRLELESEDFFTVLIHNLCKAFLPEKMLLLLPQKRSQIRIPFGYRAEIIKSFRNGGLPVEAVLLIKL